MDNNFVNDDQYFNTWALLNQARDAIFKTMVKELNGSRITVIEAAALFIIQAIGDEATPAEISRWMFREPHTVSVLLSRMERKGLIRKSNDLHRKNLVRVSLTEKGKEAYHKSTTRQSIHNALSALSKEELKQLGSYLARLRDKAIAELKIDYNLPFPPNVMV